MRGTYLFILCGWFAEDRKWPIKHERQCFIGTSRHRDKRLMWRSTEYFWRNLTCLDSRWNSVSSVWYIFLVETIKNYGEKWSSKSVKIYASKTRCPFPEGPEQFSHPESHIAKSWALWLQSCFIHAFLTLSKVLLIQEVSSVYTCPFLDANELKWLFGPEKFPGFSRNGPRVAKPPSPLRVSFFLLDQLLMSLRRNVQRFKTQVHSHCSTR